MITDEQGNTVYVDRKTIESTQKLTVKVGKDGKKVYLDHRGNPVKAEEVQVIIDENGNEVFVDKTKILQKPKKTSTFEKRVDP